MTSLFDYLSARTYPGRGLAVGTYKGASVIVYFIMGRSSNSRNRVFAKEGDRLYTAPYDETKVEDPSLIIYNAVRSFDGLTIVTNGDQTDTVFDFLSEGKSFEEALDTREYEPDAPNYTPRISAVSDCFGNCRIGILKKNGGECQRSYFTYAAKEGAGHFVSTYEDDGNPLPSFAGEPVEISVDADMEDYAKAVWNSLDPQNKVSLYVRYTDKDGFRDMIFNANEE